MVPEIRGRCDDERNTAYGGPGTWFEDNYLHILDCNGGNLEL